MALAEHESQRLKQLVASAEESRQDLAAAGRGLRNAMDVSARVQGSMKKHLGLWSGSALALGWVLSRLPSRKKTVVMHGTGTAAAGVAKKGLIISAATVAFQFFRPSLQRFATEQMALWLEKWNTGRGPEVMRPRRSQGASGPLR